MTRVKISKTLLSGSVEAPPSKSYTHRAVTLASLAEGDSDISNPLISRDTSATIDACRAFGVSIEGYNSNLKIWGDGSIKTPDDVIDAENSGTTIRFMTAVSSLCKSGYTILTGDKSIRRRPMEPLISALKKLGVECWSTRLNGLPPIVVRGGGLRGGETSIRGDVSSQFISALLISTTKVPSDTVIKVEEPLVSKTYVDATIKMIEHFGGKVEVLKDGYSTPCNQALKPTSFIVPGDFSSSSFLLAAGALTGGRVSVSGLDFRLPQSDKAIVDILGRMGVKVHVDEAGGRITVEGADELEGGLFDLSDSPDLLPVISILALKARRSVRISGVRHARFKETDRISVLASELRKLGADIDEYQDGLKIFCKKIVFKEALDAYDDHRMFMAFCIAGLASESNVYVDGLESVDVSYPNFLNDLLSLGGRVEVVRG